MSGLADPDFDAFLQDVLASATKQLAVMPEKDYTAKDPFIEALERKEEGRRKRAEEWMQKDKLTNWSVEMQWRLQVNERKQEERRRKAAEAAAAAAAAAEAEAEKERLASKIAVPALSPNERAEKAAREKAEAEMREAEQRWLDEEWMPLLAQRQQENREQRLEREERQRLAQKAEEQRLKRERRAMVTEDRAAATFRAHVTQECERLSQKAKTPKAREAAYKTVEVVLEKHGLEMRWRRSVEQRLKQEEEERRQLEEERKERDYREWREEVHEERLRRLRLKEREEKQKEEKIQELAQLRRLELQGRDGLRERELQQQAALEVAVKAADNQKKRMETRGIDPKRALEEARKLAEKQRIEQEQNAPAKAEQELWDALLAKNRLAKRHDRTLTPRWGAFAS